MNSLKSIDRWFFSHGSPTALGLIRIALGLVCVVNLGMMFGQWRDWFTESGFHPAWFADAFLGHPDQAGDLVFSRPNLYGLSNSDAWSLILFGSTFVLAVLLTVGLWTKPVSIAFAVLVVSMHHRSPVILHGGDTILRCLVLYLAMSPCGQACSLDRLRAIWAGRISREPAVAPLWSQRLISYNVSLVYFTTVWLKTGGNLWRDGLATWYPNRLQEFERFPLPPFVLEVPMVKLTTYGTLFVEFAMVTLVYHKPFRKYILAAAVLMHLFIEYSMNIPIFAFLMILSYLSFFEGSEIDEWSKQVGEKLAKWLVKVPIGQAVPQTTVDALGAMDPFDLVEYVESDEEPTKGMLRASALRSVGAWCFAWLPGVWRRVNRGGIR